MPEPTDFILRYHQCAYETRRRLVARGEMSKADCEFMDRFDAETLRRFRHDLAPLSGEDIAALRYN